MRYRLFRTNPDSRAIGIDYNKRSVIRLAKIDKNLPFGGISFPYAIIHKYEPGNTIDHQPGILYLPSVDRDLHLGGDQADTSSAESTVFPQAQRHVSGWMEIAVFRFGFDRHHHFPQ